MKRGPGHPFSDQLDGRVSELPDRRRAGRLSVANPHLIALMRGGYAAEDLQLVSVGEASTVGNPDQLRPAVGLAVGTLFSIVLWMAIYFVAHWAFF